MIVDTLENRNRILKAIKERPNCSSDEIGRNLGIAPRTVRAIIKKHCLRDKSGMVVLRTEAQMNRLQLDNSQWKAKYKNALETIADLEEMVGTLMKIPQSPVTVPIEPRKNVSREIVPVIVASDWHIEETVSRASTNGMNEYNLEIAEQSIKSFFSNAIYLVKREMRDSEINTVVVAFLGDIINGVLRDEDLQNNSLTSIDAMTIARAWIYSGLKKLVDDTGVRIKVICCVGNHGRLTEKIFHSNQVHNSLEYLMYKTLERDFEKVPKIDFCISEAYYVIQDILGMRVRFHHGHTIKFNGGIGGLSVPVLRKIAQMNLIEKADLDVCGHFHSMQIFSNCILNGSLVGVNGYSMSLGLPYEPPRQLFFLIDSKYGRTSVMPIFIDR